MPEPADLQSAIRSDSDRVSGWLALAAHYRNEGWDDEAAVLRVFWPALRDTLAAGRTLESVLDRVRRDAEPLGRWARQFE
jgi:hypothetical protein